MLTNEQKLDEIYTIIKTQEARTRRAALLRILKWTIILAIVFIASQNPDLILKKVTEYIMPSVMENMSQNMPSVMDNMADPELIKKIQESLAPSN